MVVRTFLYLQETILTVKPSLEESCDMADIDLMVAHSQEYDTDMGLNLLTVDPSLQKNCHMADSLVV